MTPELFVAIILCIVVIIFGQPLLAVLIDYGVPALKATRQRYLRIAWPDLMSHVADDEDEFESNEEPAFSPVSAAKLNSESAETPQRVAEIRAESFTLGETETLARLVASGKLGLTDAVKIGADAKSGERYQKRSREIKAAVEKFQEKYPRRTPEQDALRKELGIPKP